MGKVVLTTAARFPEAAELIAVSMYAGLMRLPDATDEWLANISFSIVRDIPYRALSYLTLKNGLLPPELTTKFQSVHGQRFTNELINQLTTELKLAELVEDGQAIRLKMMESDGHRLLAKLGIDNDEAFELVRDLGKALLQEWAYHEIKYP